ncbi:histidine phosphatase family protein [uncultured Roseobacter sp.]|uniref:histidine phosphatase family protein n=1 Tax=uncultured Roseobacter sp. TaxID=114847 RepID=UPI00260B724A|nr:histidine phosphatase family protein [uncultured Roseobacter sp.]
MSRFFHAFAIALLGTTPPAISQEAGAGRIAQISQHMGEMSMQMAMPSEGGTADQAVRETLRFEPWQMLDDLFRDDIVFLMRHGPTDWSKRDVIGVAPTDCANQRIMTPEGQDRMREMGILLAGNGIVPGRIMVSEWCRNQQTLQALLDGMAMIEPGLSEAVAIEIAPNANLLLSLRGAPTVTGLREAISSWQGGGDGPLLIISHFTNIAELTEFNVYEGEALVLDPDRGNRVLGYLRLRSAAPDVGHFDASVAP